MSNGCSYKFNDLPQFIKLLCLGPKNVLLAKEIEKAFCKGVTDIDEGKAKLSNIFS